MITLIQATEFKKEYQLLINERLKPTFYFDYEQHFLYKNIFIYEVRYFGIFCGIIICRVSYDAEFVIMHAISMKDTKIPFILMVNNEINAIAKKHYCRFIRLHSDKKALDKLIEKCGFEHYETVYIKKV